jgi:hypothetical protein
MLPALNKCKFNIVEIKEGITVDQTTTTPVSSPAQKDEEEDHESQD